MDDDMQLDLIGEHLALLDSDYIRFEEGEPLGKGGSGEVYQVFHPWNWVGSARKLMTCPSHNYRNHHNVMRQFKQELRAMRKVQHHHCVKLVLSCTSLETLTIFSSPVADRDLAQLLDSDLTRREVEMLRHSIGCITSALAYLHQLDIRHEDLKPSNILVHGFNVLLTDFGSCYEFSDTAISTTTGPAIGTTPRYRAPEVHKSEDRNRLTDVWSLGYVLFEIISRLQGHRLSTMMSFWRKKGTKEAGFANNKDAVALWFGVLTEHRTENHHGSDRKYTWLCSFVYHVLLHRKRLLRPSVVQILARLQDLDAVYPVDTLVATCCATNPGTVTSWLASCKDIPQWPVLDLMLADRKLSSIFLDTELRVRATNGNIPFFDNATTTLDGTGIERLIPATVEITRIREAANAMPKPRSLQDPFTNGDQFLEEITNSIFTCRLMGTTFWVDTLNLMLNADMLPRPRTVQLSMQTFCLDRQPNYKVPFIVMTFDLNEGEVVGGSYRQGRDVWADGFGIAAVSRKKVEVTAYESIASSVSERQRRYNNLVSSFERY
ncbi:kinase-like domain-containing protein [Paraphoma chrysanthemicola]|uniref:Kinase-like domain-containing protein n=1 Tax=Paraphoma chrysanthemicola TaxID=798071 RepID=A0A8K0QTM1_9PLEO|nr:kinase-like domain-containing protein [Paraphoma chrysanthemicola]